MVLEHKDVCTFKLFNLYVYDYLPIVAVRDLNRKTRYLAYEIVIELQSIHYDEITSLLPPLLRR